MFTLLSISDESLLNKGPRYILNEMEQMKFTMDHISL